MGECGKVNEFLTQVNVDDLLAVPAKPSQSNKHHVSARVARHLAGKRVLLIEPAKCRRAQSKIVENFKLVMSEISV